MSLPPSEPLDVQLNRIQTGVDGPAGKLNRRLSGRIAPSPSPVTEPVVTEAMVEAFQKALQFEGDDGSVAWCDCTDPEDVRAALIAALRVR